MEELHETEEFKQARDNEFTSEVPVEEFVTGAGASEASTGRRDFLKFLGFSVGAATLAACETPVTKVIPYVNKPEEVTPGLPTYYASTYFDGYDYASILVKTREGRPIYIKGNPDHGMGAINARINSSVLSLYDSTRLSGPRNKDGTDLKWEDADQVVRKALSEASGEVVFLTESIASPSTFKAMSKFSKAYPEAEVTHVQYDPRSFEGIRKANQASFGKAVIPYCDFSKAKVIVGVGADFMNDYPLSAQYTADYGSRRKPEGEWMNQHHHFEAGMSLTGSNADYRTAIKPSQEGLALAAIYNHITGQGATNELSDATSRAASALKKAAGESLVLAGSNDAHVQMIASAINEALGNFGQTIDMDRPVRMSNGNAKDFESLISRMESGSVSAIFMHGVNPAYDSPMADAFVSGLAKVPLSISFSMHADETAKHCSHILPSHHAMESWNDFNVVGAHYALAQPTISPLNNTRQFQESILKWSGYEGSYHDFIKENWTSDMVAMQSERSGDDFWNYSLHNGSVDLNTPMPDSSPLASDEEGGDSATDISVALASVQQQAASAQDIEVFLYTKVGIGTGSHATNPWLQELPDPITKICWDNYATLSPADVAAQGFNMHLGEELPATVVTITLNGVALELPAVPVPGQKSGTVGIALGYGRGAGDEEIGRAAFLIKERGGYELDDNGLRKPIGANAFRLVTMNGDTFSYAASGASVAATGAEWPIASTQTHHTLMDRTSVLKETTLETFQTADSKVYNPPHVLPMHENGEIVQKPVSEVDLWDEHPIEDIGHWWGLSIDLSSCLGCGACITACHSENNVPVVGKDEVRRSRDMHWLRIDRYFSSGMDKEKGAEEGLSKIEMYRQMEIPSENPSVVHMPMMCQHCNHAPCETVCPVAATTHSSEGINQMTYNRCIGTRYCANNCPYKVRRFNWFNYKAYAKFTEVNPTQDWTGRMVLNPDVTVRSRGVMEKCSMCMQRIQAGKLDAKINGTPVPDGSIQTACSEVCPNDCITFGDMNDEDSMISKRKGNKRSYLALEEVGTRPSISYMVKVRNREENQA
ncbi:MAG: TAT-variant-translocated molybdopterin oxidoreductase [Flavobacteriales bacterium]|nr:TAT-variant-translocated molybdopterin oxidoreductase [Flavobacteriales bacterium]